MWADTDQTSPEFLKPYLSRGSPAVGYGQDPRALWSTLPYPHRLPRGAEPTAPRTITGTYAFSSPPPLLISTYRLGTPKPARPASLVGSNRETSRTPRSYLWRFHRTRVSPADQFETGRTGRKVQLRQGQRLEWKAPKGREAAWTPAWRNNRARSRSSTSVPGWALVKAEAGKGRIGGSW